MFPLKALNGDTPLRLLPTQEEENRCNQDSSEVEPIGLERSAADSSESGTSAGSDFGFDSRRSSVSSPDLRSQEQASDSQPDTARTMPLKFGAFQWAQPVSLIPELVVGQFYAALDCADGDVEGCTMFPRGSQDVHKYLMKGIKDLPISELSTEERGYVLWNWVDFLNKFSYNYLVVDAILRVFNTSHTANSQAMAVAAELLSDRAWNVRMFENFARFARDFELESCSVVLTEFTDEVRHMLNKAVAYKIRSIDAGALHRPFVDPVASIRKASDQHLHDQIARSKFRPVLVSPERFTAISDEQTVSAAGDRRLQWEPGHVHEGFYSKPRGGGSDTVRKFNTNDWFDPSVKPCDIDGNPIKSRVRLNGRFSHTPDTCHVKGCCRPLS